MLKINAFSSAELEAFKKSYKKTKQVRKSGSKQASVSSSRTTSYVR